MRTQTQKTSNSTKAEQVSSQRSSTAQYFHPVLKLQQQIGNQAVQRLIQSRRIQAKLTIGQPNDKYEQEADRVADQIMRMPDPSVTEQNHRNLTTQRAVIQRLFPESNEGLQSQQAEEIDKEEEKLLQAKEMPGQTPVVSNVVESTINNLRGGGQALSPNDRSFLEPRFGQDFSQVRVHTDTPAANMARTVNARAFTLDKDIVFGSGEYSPWTGEGMRLLAHELTHTVQQRGVSPMLQCYGDPIPAVVSPSVVTMRDYIDLIRRIEVVNPGLGAFGIAQMIMRTKYHSTGFDYLLPSSAGGAGVTASGGVTTADVTTLTGEFEVTLPQGGTTDTSHIMVGITAGAETQSPGAGGAGGLAGFTIAALPGGVTARDIATWVGDVASAAAEWATAHLHPDGGTTKQAYMDEYSPEFDLLGDIDGIVMTSRSAAVGFAFDPTQALSTNLENFYFPTNPLMGKNRRFHSFCQIEGLGLTSNGVTLSAAAMSNIKNRIELAADWFERNDPNLTAWMVINSEGLFNPIRDAWIARANDWQWFANKFIDFVQRNLTAEGP